jgi:hypothetical protein
MNESEFREWAASHELRQLEVESLIMSASYAEKDSLTGRVALDCASIAEYTDDEIINACPFDEGFVVFGDCPNGDMVAIDVKRNVGTIHYLSHEESDGCSFPSIKVANSMEQFLDRLGNDKMPTDYHEALSWNFEADEAR